MIKIAPAILLSNLSQLGNEIQRTEEGGANYIHFDIMDGHFVPKISIGASIIASLRNKTTLPFDVHLMIEKPEHHIKQFVNAGSDIISVHVEACRHLHRVVTSIKEYGIKASVALNPATPLSSIEYVLDSIDMVLIMTINPSFSGESFVTNMLEKISKLKELCVKRNLNIDIEVDGGVSLDTISEIAKAGANVFVVGSAVYKAKDIKQAISALLKKTQSIHSS